jgi:SAM-dependent methyltransferase
MMFFQNTLLLGYLYSFWSVGSLNSKRQASIHLGLLSLSLLTLPILPGASWKPIGAGEPISRILFLLAATVGVPYLVLSTTGPLLQAWYASLNRTKLPYRLYALSNFGSLLALLSYPLLIEPLFRLSRQAYGWSAGYAAFALLCGSVAVVVLRSPISGEPALRIPVEIETGPAPGWRELLLWIGLAACPSALLLAITTHLTQNIAPIPLLWVVPLAIYLLTLVLCFDSDRWYVRPVLIPLWIVATGAMVFYIFPERRLTTLEITVPVFLGGLFLCCMVCHGELAARKPATRWLTSFYLMLAIGGALGGIFVAVIAPLVFKTLLELPIALTASTILVGIALYQAGFIGLWTPSRLARIQFGGLAGVSVAALYLTFIAEPSWVHQQTLVTRNFYGELRVLEKLEGQEIVRHLFHGTINHGSQGMRRAMRRRPVSYYSPLSGVGRAIADRQARGPIKLGVIGLGAGTLAAYGRAGDAVEFYEINPLVEKVARSQFTYLSDCPAKLNIVFGDARRSLETQSNQGFDVLAVDAFSGDAIPVHLLTQEAFREYFRHTRPDGILAVHISNRYLDLEWVVRMEADALGKKAVLVSDEVDDNDPLLSRSDWMLLSSQPNAFSEAKWAGLSDPDVRNARRPKDLQLWTDEYSNLFSILHTDSSQ